LGNESADNGAYWIDLLDDPLVGVLKTIFFEVRDEDYQSLPINNASPYHFRWRDILESLEKVESGEDSGGLQRVKLDTPSIATMAMFMERLRKKETYSPPKTTANDIFVVAQGSGTTRVGDQSFSWSYGDVIAVPSWTNYSHEPAETAILLRVTDQPVMEALGWFRTENNSTE